MYNVQFIVKIRQALHLLVRQIPDAVKFRVELLQLLRTVVDHRNQVGGKLFAENFVCIIRLHGLVLNLRQRIDDCIERPLRGIRNPADVSCQCLQHLRGVVYRSGHCGTDGIPRFCEALIQLIVLHAALHGNVLPSLQGFRRDVEPVGIVLQFRSACRRRFRQRYHSAHRRGGCNAHGFGFLRHLFQLVGCLRQPLVHAGKLDFFQLFQVFFQVVCLDVRLCKLFLQLLVFLCIDLPGVLKLFHFLPEVVRLLLRLFHGVPEFLLRDVINCRVKIQLQAFHQCPCGLLRRIDFFIDLFQLFQKTGGIRTDLQLYSYLLFALRHALPPFL